MSVRLKAKLPAGDLDGLQGLESRLMQGEAIQVPIVGMVTLHRIITDCEDLDAPTQYVVRFVAIEAATGANVAKVEKMVDGAYTARTGKAKLDLEATSD